MTHGAGESNIRDPQSGRFPIKEPAAQPYKEAYLWLLLEAVGLRLVADALGRTVVRLGDGAGARDCVCSLVLTATDGAGVLTLTTGDRVASGCFAHWARRRAITSPVTTHADMSTATHSLIVVLPRSDP